MSLLAAMRSVFERTEIAFDGAFGGADNPLRHLGALGLFFLWILVVSGLYLYTVLDTSIDGVYNSIGWLTREQWYLGGVMRSLHRYASDAFVLVMFLHLLRVHFRHRRLLDRLGPAGAVLGGGHHRAA